jgi:hypothetical protein
VITIPAAALVSVGFYWLARLVAPL